MREMMINNTDISEYGARLLEFTVGGTTLTRVTGTSYNANMPKIFHSDYGQRPITLTVVFKPKYYKFGGTVAKLHSLAMQKAAFDAKVCKGISDIWLPDGFYYNCVLVSVGDEVTDGESLEVIYTLNGIRHLPMAKIKGKNIYCSSTVKTDCRITVSIGSGWIDGTSLHILMNRLTKDYNSYIIKNINAGDIVIIDGINCTVTKNGDNIFSDTNIVTFPYLCSGENEYIEMTGQECTFVTEYYPTFI